jgi:hypothetical protein
VQQLTRHEMRIATADAPLSERRSLAETVEGGDDVVEGGELEAAEERRAEAGGVSAARARK